jgi:hypothetical protein
MPVLPVDLELFVFLQVQAGWDGLRVHGEDYMGATRT